MDDPEKKPLFINYLYFGALLALLAITSMSNIFLKDNHGGSSFFFFLYAMGQALLEVAILAFIAAVIRSYLHKFWFALFIGFTFFAFLIHSANFILDRILDLSVWETMDFVLDETWSSFLYLLDASGIPLWVWFSGFVLIAAFPLIGYGIYRATEKIARKRPLLLRTEVFIQTFFCLPAALLIWEFTASKTIHPDAYTSFLKSLPWKSTFLQPNNVTLQTAFLQASKTENEVHQAIASMPQNIEKKPNIYLFIIESFRGDFIDDKVAPHLNRFKSENISYEPSVSNATASHISWFSIFHSQFPYFWKQHQEKWTSGSPALRLLKKWGYKIRLYSSAQLGYYGMENLLFGEDLIDVDRSFPHPPPKQAHESDFETLQALQEDLENDPSLAEGQVFIVFWDSTHFDYSWPKDKPAKFTPYAKEFAYFRAYNSQKNIELIKNRYKNAVNYVDELFGKFYNALPKKEEAVVVVLGDHAEEFFEHGHLFHGSHLVHEQMNIPLYFKFGTEKKVASHSVVSQMDIFPSIIDYVSGEVPGFLEGQSIFRERKWPFAVIARFNAGRAPYEFCIHNGKNKLIAQFRNRSNIFKSYALKLISLRQGNDRDLPRIPRQSKKWVSSEFGRAFERLFPETSSRQDSAID